MDTVGAQRWLHRVATTSPWLHEEVGSRMADRLPWFREKPNSWLNWEPVQGGLQVHRKVRGMLPEATCQLMARRPAQAMEATREAPARSLNPLKWGRPAGPGVATSETRVRMLWANMALHMEPRPQTLLTRWHQQIETDGFLMFSCLGPDSLKELRALYAGRGWPAPAHAFTDMHDWGDMLVHAGFAEPVMDMERITLSYSGAAALLAELRGIGRNLSDQRFGACRSRDWHARLCAAIESDLPRSPDGRLMLTLEIIYGHAFKPVPRARVASSTTLAVDDMRAMLRAGRR